MFEGNKSDLPFIAVALLVMALVFNPEQWALVTVFIVIPALAMTALITLFVLVDIVIEKIKTQTGG